MHAKCSFAYCLQTAKMAPFCTSAQNNGPRAIILRTGTGKINFNASWINVTRETQLSSIVSHKPSFFYLRRCFFSLKLSGNQERNCAWIRRSTLSKQAYWAGEQRLGIVSKKSHDYDQPTTTRARKLRHTHIPGFKRSSATAAFVTYVFYIGNRWREGGRQRKPIERRR